MHSAAIAATRSVSDQPKAKQRKQPSGEHAELIRHFTDAWKTKCGADYSFEGGKDGKHVAWMLAQVKGDLAKAKRIVDAFFADNDPWVADKGRTIGLLKPGFNRYLAKISTQRAAGAVRQDK